MTFIDNDNDISALGVASNWLAREEVPNTEGGK